MYIYNFTLSVPEKHPAVQETKHRVSLFLKSFGAPTQRWYKDGTSYRALLKFSSPNLLDVILYMKSLQAFCSYFSVQMTENSLVEQQRNDVIEIHLPAEL